MIVAMIVTNERHSMHVDTIKHGIFHGKVVVMAVEGNQREDYKMYCICVGEC